MRVCIIALLALSLLVPGARRQASANPGRDLVLRQDGLAQVVVELVDPPAAKVYASERPRGVAPAAAATQRQVRKLDQLQRGLIGSIHALGGKVLYRTQRAYNGLGVLIPAAQVGALQRLVGVQAVHPAVLHRPSNATSVPLIGAPGAWSYAGGVTGRGQKIAIIDTGIDYTHLDLGGPGTTAAFAAASANPSVVEPGSGFPNAKVAGGIDLAGDNYDAGGISGSTTPAPDPDPIDCYSGYGHGTHVAGTAAGYGVNGDGTRYAGPYDMTTPSHWFRVGPGVAPEATLYAVKIFGCGGSSAITPAGIEWAMDPNGDGDLSDHMDVINLSLGSPFGAPYDASAVAADNAAQAGVVVVTSAGNQGDTAYVVSTPSTSSRAISVAATAGSSPDTANIAGYSSRGPRRGDNALKPDIAAPGDNIFSANRGSGSDGRYLSGTSMASPHVAGSAALVRQMHPDWSVEEVKAALLNTAGPHPVDYGGRTYSPTRGGAGRVNVDRAVRTTAVVYNADDPGLVSLPFGAPEVVDTFAAVKNLRIVDKRTSGAATTFRIGITPILTATGLIVTSTLRTVTLQPGASATIPIGFAVQDGRVLSQGHDPTMDAQSNGMSRHFLNEVAGFVTLAPEIQPDAPLQVAYWGAPRRAASMSAGQAPLTLQRDGGTADITIRGTSSAAPALVSLYELQHINPPKSASSTEAGSVAIAGAAADLRYVGVASDFRQTHDVATTTISFGLATYSSWTTPSDVTFMIDVDTNRDGAFDYTIATTDVGPAGSGYGAGGVFLTQVGSVPTGSGAYAGRLNYLDAATQSGLYNGRVTGWSVPASRLGLSDAQSRFDYRVRTYHLDVYDAAFAPVLVDETPLLTYDVAQPGLDLTGAGALLAGAPIYRDDGGATLHIGYDATAFAANHSQGILLLHHTNTAETQAEVIRASVEPPPVRARLYFPLVIDGAP